MNVELAKIKVIAFLLILLGGLFVNAPESLAEKKSEDLQRFTYTQYHMGIDARITVYTTSEAKAEEACIAAFSRIAELDSIMSDYRVESELNILCSKAGSGPSQVSADLFRVLDRAQAMARNSEGAFDVTIGPLVQLWRQVRKSGKLPMPSEVRAAKSLVGYQKLVLNHKAMTASLAMPGMKLDLGGIAKGDACDQAQKVLMSYGIAIALVEMGGDLVMSNPPPKSRGWTIRVPNAGTDKGPADLQFANCAVSTSGDTEQFVVISGKQYSHVVDPRTGYALTNRVQSTVVAREGLTSDPLATALTILNAKDRPKLLRHYPTKQLFLRELASP